MQKSELLGNVIGGLFGKPLTNSEKKVSAYTRTDMPTNPRNVKPSTSLSSLNLNWRERDLPEKERTKHVHRLHPYLGKFIPQLVEIFLRKYFKTGQTVLDPFCGSGTTLVQANELGINSIGYDISEFNIMLTRAKTHRYDLKLASEELIDIVESVTAVTPFTANQRSLWLRVKETLELSEPDTAYLKDWFASQAIRELLAYRKFIDTRDYKYKDLMKIILCRSARSARLTTHFELDYPKVPVREPYWCHKHSRMCTPTTEAGKFLRRYTIDTIRRINDYAKLQTSAKSRAFHADSRKVRIPKIDGVLTSPPYVGLIDYHEQHAYAYHLLGLKDERQSEIGAAANGTKQDAKNQYVEDIATVFMRCARSMPSGGLFIVVANDRHNIYRQIAEKADLKSTAIVERHVNRRTGMRSSEFFESVFIWEKR